MPTTPKALIVATHGFEQSELFEPRRALLDAGVDVRLASLALDPIQGTILDEKADTITPDALIADMRVDDFDMLVLPGGVANPDKLRTDAATVRLVRDFMAAGKPVAAICHGPWLLAEAEVVDGRTVTAWPSIRTDLRHAGATVIDKEVAVDGNLITSRQPEDLPAFNAALLAALGVEQRADA
ncbi:type 1 glutamine amidotransferase domain-containing protein [Sphingomonas nostoxanthinifaciens]|uniref:type 1 glutamine amidotransferase domain-containing protein n=1 Tax=Sphingomonas nostoxanthinifaciens TaxID=2872652 RepID=UPI001CC1D5D0|nr:type 1 glutamine amidotransferase domain-containing protein [Sphingomonas nostoxanthinifaciens]UAK23576.1 type 1 glutamine amidotransferase [Sphingomonas nostoxanthinifaciens]